MLGARLSAPIGYNLACSIEVASLAVMCPLGPASASNLVKSNVIEWKSADENLHPLTGAQGDAPHRDRTGAGDAPQRHESEQCRPPLHGGQCGRDR